MRCIVQFKVKQPPEIGDKRIIKKFLILPRELNGIVKWLEVASWEQEYRTVYHFKDSAFFNAWTDTRWADKSTV